MTTKALKGKKILFANFPADGHFNPLTGLAVHLKEQGCEIEWYTSTTFAAKIERLGIKHRPFCKAKDVSNNNFDKAFPERLKYKSQVSRLKFDIIHAFILRAPEYYEDICEIHKSFPFDLMVADCAFSAIPFIKDLMKKPVVAIGVLPLPETSKDLPPSGLGLTPSYSAGGRLKQRLLRWATNRFIFNEPNRVMHSMLDKYNIRHEGKSLFDVNIIKSDVLLQSGTPGFEYYRSDLSANVRFAGAILPYTGEKQHNGWFDRRINQYSRVVLVTQGTVEKDINKLLLPTLEAFKDEDTLVIATTGGSETESLRERYPYKNIIIEDFIPFADIMPYADVYVTNGGYGGVMLAIENNLPMVVAGIHEGKNEICARVGYFGLGVNLKTEKPRMQQIKKAVMKVSGNEHFKYNVSKLSEEFSRFDPFGICAGHIARLLHSNASQDIIEPIFDLKNKQHEKAVSVPA